MTRLRIGVIGAGAFAAACHIPGLQGHPQADVAMLCGRDRTRTETLARRFGVPAVTLDPRELCASGSIDAVTICTPTDAHFGPALLALSHGKHVFCEKPLALTLGEAEELAACARASGLIHQVGFTFRHLEGVRELRRRVRAGDIGEPLFLQARHEYCDELLVGPRAGWRYDRAASRGGVLHETGAHLFDVARFLLGPISQVRASARPLRQGIESDDVVSVDLRFAGGAEGQWIASRISPARTPNHVRVVGQRGSIEALISRGGWDALYLWRSSAWHEVALPRTESPGAPYALGRMMRCFVDACLTGHLDDGAGSFVDGLAVQQDLDAAERASDRGGWVETTGLAGV